MNQYSDPESGAIAQDSDLRRYSRSRSTDVNIYSLFDANKNNKLTHQAKESERQQSEDSTNYITTARTPPEYFEPKKITCKEKIQMLYEGLCRLQTMFLAIFLFGIETDHVCIVSYGSKEPLSQEQLASRKPYDGSDARLWDMSQIFQTILLTNFCLSATGTLLHFYKLYFQLKSYTNPFHRIKYLQLHAYFQKLQLLSVSFLLLTPCVYFLQPGRICSGWSVLEIKETKGDDYQINYDNYLIKRGGFFGFLGFMGICFLISFIVLEIKSKKKNKQEI